MDEEPDEVMTTTDPFIHGTNEPAPDAARRGGRPRGATTDPRIKAATDARKGKPEPAPEPPPAARQPGRPSNDDKLRQSLAQMHGAAGMTLTTLGVVVLRQPRMAAAGAAMVEQADACADALVKWAAVNPKVRKYLTAAMTAGGAGAVLFAYLPIVLAAWNPPAGIIEGAEADAEAGSAADLASLAALLNFAAGPLPT